MKINFCIFSLLFTVMLVSCNDGKQDVVIKDIELNNEDTPGEINNDIATINTDNIIKNLQGKWKETEYPFREAHFDNTTVKFIEEGVAEEPVFREYTLSEDCPFEVSNIKNATPVDIFLVIAEARTCEILMISNDILTLSGFNVSSNSDYHIVYIKVE